MTAYTVIPVKESKCLHLDFHYNRLISSALALQVSRNMSETALNLLRCSYEYDFKSNISTAIKSTNSCDGLLVACATLSPSERECSFDINVDMMLYPCSISLALPASVAVDVYLFVRLNPSAKSCGWTEDRKFIEKERSAGSVETLLCKLIKRSDGQEEDCALLEGLTSNLVVIEEGGVLVTAVDQVLPGSVLDLLMRECAADAALSIRREAPRVSRAHLWTCAFLTSNHYPPHRTALILWRVAVWCRCVPIHAARAPDQYGGTPLADAADPDPSQ